MSETFFSEDFKSTFEDMHGVLDRAVSAMIKAGCIPPEEEFRARLCLEEALVNAIQHGNRCDPHCTVGLEIVKKNGHCTMRVRDEGGGFLPEQIYMPAPEQLGGRGVCLIRHYMDKIAYNEAEHCLEMDFRIPSGSQGGPSHERCCQ